MLKPGESSAMEQLGSNASELLRTQRANAANNTTGCAAVTSLPFSLFFPAFTQFLCFLSYPIPQSTARDLSLPQTLTHTHFYLFPPCNLPRT